jgi:hypothetical protein
MGSKKGDLRGIASPINSDGGKKWASFFISIDLDEAVMADKTFCLA